MDLVGPRLVTVSGTEAYPLKLGAQRIGRDASSDVVIAAPSVSETHASISWDGTSATITDAGSLNGTAVNGETISAEHPLRPGDIVQLAEVELRFDLGTDTAGQTGQTANAEDESYLDFKDEWVGATPPPALDDRPQEVEPTWPGEDVSPPVDVSPVGQSAPTDESLPSRVTGVARNVQLRYDQQNSRNVLSFHLDRYDSSGNRLPPVAVELRHHQQGQVADGDQVRIVGSMKHGTLLASEIVNLTTGSEIRGIPGWAKWVLLTVFLAIVSFIIGIAIWGFFFFPDNQGPAGF